jgi:DNA polymerase I-like protein with 3'-5' exonuclease and polymerase domains/intein/homing endonuclease
MTIYCSCCGKWSSLPLDGGRGKKPRASCEHCTAPLPVDDRYDLCLSCGCFYLGDYDECPFCPYAALVTETSADSIQPAYFTEPRSRKARDGSYYWQLYIDYQLETQTTDLSAGEVRSQTSNGHGAEAPYTGNGSVDLPLAEPGAGSSNGHAAPPTVTSSVDLAVTESVPLALFNDAEPAAGPAEETPAGVSAGAYNEFEYELVSDPSRLAEIAEMLAREQVVGIDTETTGLDPHSAELLLLQVSTTDRVYVVDCKRLVPLALKPLLENPQVLKVAQNAKFEYEMLKQQAGIVLAGMYDTMLAERVLTAGLAREISLKQIAQKYIGAVLDKTVRESFYKLASSSDAYLAPEQLHYAARDAYIMIPIWHHQRPELKKHDLERVAELEFRCIAAVGDMELVGVKIDEASWRKIISDVGVQRDKSSAELCEMLEPASMQATMFGVPSINLNSNVQLIEAFGKLGVDLPDTMEATLVRFDHAAVKKLLEYRGHEKTLSAFGENVLSLINPKTGRIHPDFNQHGADTGRFSCTRPNVQQIPATSDFRKCFVAPEGYKLITSDYSQCIAKDTWVSTENKWVRIQDHPAAVSKGEAETVIVTTGRKYRLECTSDHRLLTPRGWVEASQLGTGEWVALSGDARWNPAPLDERAWLEGFWVGDGCYNRANTIAYFSKGALSSREELRSFVTTTLWAPPKEFGDSFGVKGQRAFVARTRVYDKKDLRLPLDRIEHLNSFLCGLFDADGTADRNGVSFSTRFLSLAQDVQIALLRYGIMSTIVSSVAGRNFFPEGRVQHQVRVSDTVSLRNYARHIGFRFAEKAARLKSTLVTKSARDQGNYLPVSSDVVRAMRLPYKKYVFSHIHGRPYTRVKLDGFSSCELDVYKRYHWDQVESVAPSGRRVEVFDLMDQPEQRFEAAGFVVHNCELRILAELSGDEGFVSAFKSGDDLHTLTASQMFGVPIDQVQKPQRSAAKAINFGLAYGMGPGGLAPRLGVSLDEAKELIARYFKAYPAVQKWLDKAAREAVRNGYSVTTLGRKRFYTPPDENLKRTNEDEFRRQLGAVERQGKNSPIQGCVRGNTHILVKNQGYVPIEEVCGQDLEVWDGESYVKASVAYSGKKKLVKITLRGGHHIECSPDHKFWVACNNGYKWVWKWKTPGEIREQNRVALGNCPAEWSLPLDIQKAVPATTHNASRACLTDLTDTREMGEWLGRLASDGYVGNNRVTIMVAEHEESILDRLQSTTERWGHVYHAVRVTDRQPKRFHTLVVGAKGLHDQLLSVGIKERVPRFVWRDSTLLAAYLRGLFDGDGSVHPDGATLTFGQGDKHLTWAREIQEALLLFGIRSRMAVYTNSHKRINLRIMKKDMPLFCERIGFINSVKQEKALQIRPTDRWERISPQYGIAMLVESIEFTDEWVDMYDVVNSESGRFMANGMIVHNSNADMTKLALINLRTVLKDWDARTVNTVHDEIVVEVRADQAEEVKHIVEQQMVRAGETILKTVPVVAEASVADYWSK